MAAINSIAELRRYYSKHYRQLAADASTEPTVDFRCLLPGLISAETIPYYGGTSIGPEMLHAAAQGIPLRFVRPILPAVYGDADAISAGRASAMPTGKIFQCV